MKSLIEQSISDYIRQKDEEMNRKLMKKQIEQIDQNKWISYLSLAISIASIAISISCIVSVEIHLSSGEVVTFANKSTSILP